MSRKLPGVRSHPVGSIDSFSYDDKDNEKVCVGHEPGDDWFGDRRVHCGA